MAERVCAVCGGPITEPQQLKNRHDFTEDCVAHVRATLQAEIDQLKVERSVNLKGDERYYWPDGSLKWGHPVNVIHLILQLQTLDPEMKVSSVLHIDTQQGTKARAYGLSMSRERWDENGWLNYKLNVPECLAIWATQREQVEGLAAEAEIDRLRKIIADAPHERFCRS